VDGIATASYRQRDPSAGELHTILRQHLATFRSSLEATGMPLPAFVNRELQRAWHRQPSERRLPRLAGAEHGDDRKLTELVLEFSLGQAGDHGALRITGLRVVV